MTKSFVAVVAALTLSAAFAGSAMAASFDGQWSVLVTTDSGRCDVTYRIPLKIEKGQVSYAGAGNFKVSGRVASGGAINVNIIYGQSTSGGAGRLSGKRGVGTWSGAGPGATCSGRWEADRVS
jgi:hypothetical protein